MRLSRTLIAGHKREIGRYDFPWVGSLPGFGRGMTVEVFHIDGIWLFEMERLNKAQR